MKFNEAFHKDSNYEPPDGTNFERQRRQEAWEKYQQQLRAQKNDMAGISEDPEHASTSASRKRADSMQPHTSSHPVRSRRPIDIDASTSISPHVRSSYYHENSERPRRFSSAEHYQSLSPAISHPYGEIRRLSGNFNAPTHVEIERQKKHKRSSKGIGKLKSTIKGLERA